MKKELRNDDFFDFHDFPLKVLRRDPQPIFPRHSHQFFELIIITKGSAFHKINDSSFPVEVGDIFIIQNDIEHEFYGYNNLSLINIIFDPEQLFPKEWGSDNFPGFKALLYLEPEYRLSHHFKSRLQVIGKEFRQIINLVEELDMELNKQEPGFKLISKTIFMHLLYLLARLYTHSASSHSKLLVRIAYVMNYLDNNFQKVIKVEELAKIAKMSIRNFQRSFKKANGISAQKYLLNIRLENAARLLKTSNMQISEISYKSGFSDSNYFSKQFRRKYQITPKKFQK